jgi:hypothetical protein
LRLIVSTFIAFSFGGHKSQLPSHIALEKVARDLSHLVYLAQQEHVSILVRKSMAGLWDEAVSKGETKMFPTPCVLSDNNDIPMLLEVD